MKNCSNFMIYIELLQPIGGAYGTLTVLGFAVDMDGVYGDIYRMSAEITREGASPVSEFSASGLSLPETAAEGFPSAALQKGTGTDLVLSRFNPFQVQSFSGSILSRFNRQ